MLVRTAPAGLGSLGLVSSLDECEQGKLDVAALRTTFEELVARQLVRREHWESAVADLERQLADLLQWWDAWIPFNSDCGLAQQLGQQARELKAELYAAADVAAPPERREPTDWLDLVPWLVGGAALLVFAPMLFGGRRA